MIASILPGAVAVHEELGDVARPGLAPAEAELVARAVPRRQREFATGRHCAHQALAALGRDVPVVGAGPRREPLWPDGVVGSITHCAGYRAAAVAHAADLAGLGIDAEPHEPLPAEVRTTVLRPEEVADMRCLCEAAGWVHWDRVTFCAKEAVYKAWYPLTGRWLDFHDVRVCFEPGTARFEARLLVDGARRGGGEALSVLAGRFVVEGGLVGAAVVVV